MGDLIQWISSNWDVILVTSLAVIGSASLIVKSIAPLTANKKDDKVAGWLDKVHALLSKLALNPKDKE